MKILISMLSMLISLFVQSAEIPLRIPGDFTTIKQQYEHYYPKSYAYKNKYREFIGEYWYQKWSKPKNFSDKKFLSSFFKLNPSLQIEKHKGNNVTFYSIDSARELHGQIYFYNTDFTIDLIKKGSYKPIATFNNKPLNYSTKIKEKLPETPALPRIDGFQIVRSKYKQFDKMIMYYKGEGSTSGKREVEGKYWEASYQVISKDRIDHRYQIAHNIIDEVKKSGGKVLHAKGGDVFYEITFEGKTSVAKLSAYNNSVTVKLIELQAFVQTLNIDPDELKMALDKTGKVELQGIYFDTNKATLKPESQNAIDAVVILMKKFPDLVIQVQGHTDSDGSDESNLKLSDARSASVKNAIIKNGIEAKRLSSKGYGEQRPVASNTTDDGKAKNRRVELHRISGGENRAMISIDFIKPMPNAKLIKKREYKQYDFHFPVKGKRQQFRGNQVVYEYHILDKKGKINKNISRLEVIKNYQYALKSLKPNELKAEGGTLYFIFANRGDKKSVMGSIDAYDGTYNVRFYSEFQ